MIEGDANGRGFQYPIPTYSITRDFDWSETENNKLLFEMTAKFGTPYFSNYINSDMEPSDIRSMCCRLRLDTSELRKRGGGLFGSNPMTGSIGVVTLNLPRLCYLAQDEEDLMRRLDGLLELAKRNGLEKVYVHCFLDGRDTPPASGKGYVEQLEAKMKEIGVGEVASVMGRYYAMDRDNNYDRVKLAYDALTKGEGLTAASGPEGIQASYDRNETDEFVKPTVVVKNGAPVATIQDKDSIIFYNFRPDRAREITHAFCDDDFKGFARDKKLDVVYVCFTEYDPTIPNKEVAFHKVEVTNTFGEWLAANHMTQARIAETEKYAHVTFFFNGGVETPNEGEDRILVNSPKVATYDLKPEMSAYEVCDKLVEAITSDKYDVIIVNFANPDMVGHTGVEAAAIQAVEAVDACVGRAVEAIKSVDGVMFICADHGNAEQLIDYETGAPFTAHTTNQVPFILVNYDPAYTLREGGCLADIVPTLIEVMGKEQPVEMTGKSLLIKK